jgi:hypothetical protein
MIRNNRKPRLPRGYVFERNFARQLAINVSDSEVFVNNITFSQSNLCFIEVVSDMLLMVLKKPRNAASTITIITPYNAQRAPADVWMAIGNLLRSLACDLELYSSDRLNVRQASSSGDY